jgi:S-adenosylmethionine:tRNA ribosyltransferase-isomerase
MFIKDFDFTLPDELIAQFPLEKRDSSKLLRLDRDSGEIRHGSFLDIEDELSSSDILVLNDTKVIKARLYGHKKTGARIELFLLSPIDDLHWKALIKPAKRLSINDDIIISDSVSITLIKKEVDHCVIKFNTDLSVYDVLETHGHVPIPPYIESAKKNANAYQKVYQTVFAENEGAVAAPTAGLHFTPKLLEKLQQKGVTVLTITLHVGYGTFKPISVDNIKDHQMHYERYFISENTASTLNSALDTTTPKKRIIAVGTTSVRTLESAFNDGQIRSGWGESNIFIYPGYKFNSVDGMITNFHLPKSSLILLVSAFAGKDAILNSYKEAIKKHYRFYSFGDAMYIS